MLDALLDQVSKLEEQPDVIVFTGMDDFVMMGQLQYCVKLTPKQCHISIGDGPPHNVWRQSREFNPHAIEYISAKINEKFPNTPFFGSFGNHAAFPVNQFNPNIEDDAAWLYEPIARMWSQWLDATAVATLSKFGYYTATVPNHDKFRIVSLNTNLHNSGMFATSAQHLFFSISITILKLLFNPKKKKNTHTHTHIHTHSYTDDFWLWAGEDDWGQMLEWLENVMSNAVANNEKVYIIGHHPPGPCHDFYRDRLYATLVRHRAALVTTMWGHTHDESMAILMDTDTETLSPVATMFTTGSVSASCCVVNFYVEGFA